MIGRMGMFFGLFLFCFVFIGCVGGNSRYQIVERISAEEQSVSAVANSPTSFVLSGYEAEQAWKQAQLFFRQYTNRFVFRKMGDGAGAMLVSRDDTTDKYLYRVEKRPQGDAFEFVVVCAPNLPSATREAAAQNSKNLARFLREGTLEMSLLDR